MGRWITGVLSVFALFVIANGYSGWRNAHLQSPALIVEAAQLIATGHGIDQLPAEHVQDILNAHDPHFYKHNGVAFRRDAFGSPTVTQHLAQPIAKAGLIPRISAISGTTYALALDEQVPKPAQLALFLNQIPMGTNPDGDWVYGFFDAAEIIYGKHPKELTQAEFHMLVDISTGRSKTTLADLMSDAQTQLAKIKLP